MMFLPYWLAAAFALILCYATQSLLRKKQRLPPGPPADPIIGHARKIPQTESWKTFAQWSALYGPVVSTQVLGRCMIILDTISAARDLLEKKGGNFSDRPKFPAIDMMGWGNILPIQPYGVKSRMQRKLMQQFLGPSTLQSLSGIQESHVHKFLSRLLVAPEDFFDHIRGHIGGTIIRVVYGHETGPNPMADPFIQMQEEAATMTVASGTFGATILDLLPFLRHVPSWFPGMGLKRSVLEIRKKVDVIISAPFEEVKALKSAGKATPCVVYSLLDECEDTQRGGAEYEADMKDFAASFYNAGVDTIKTSLQVFFLMMVLNPDMQKRAQVIIDEAIGSDRLPSFNDRPHLPYIECVLKEVFRIHPPAPIGVPHQSLQADDYNGWTIPARSMVIANIWHMMRDEEAFPNPDTFDPERHVVNKGNADEYDPVSAVFGFGRRFCPGRAFAESLLWLTIANVLASFDILPFIDPVTGEEKLPAVEYEFEFVNSVKPFKCSIVPRKERISQIVRETGYATR